MFALFPPAEALKLRVRFRRVGEASALRDGWRGLVDFGERWSQDDAALWPSGDLPVGKPLTYGCEMRLVVKADEAAGADGEAILRLWGIDVPRPVMTPGASLQLCDGGNVRATGELLAVER